MSHFQVQFGLWLSRYITTGLLFFLGLRAPGLPRRPYMLLINEDERDVENGRQVAVSSPLCLLVVVFSSKPECHKAFMNC